MSNFFADRRIENNYLLLKSVGEAIILFLFLLYVILFLSFVFGIAFGVVTAWGAVACSLALAVFMCRGPNGWSAKAASSGVIIILFSVVISGQLFDYSWDGQWYHQSAVGALAGGWNPLSGPFDAHFLGVPSGDFGASMARWDTHYPKASWFMGTIFYLATGSIQSAKAINILAAVAVFCSAAAFLLRAGLPLRSSLLLGGLAAANPVAVAQMGTFYVDGLASSMLTLVVLGLAAAIWWGEERDLGLPALALMIGVNLKFTILVMIVVLCVFAAVAMFWRYRRGAIVRVSILAGCGIAGVVFLGWSPYVQNTLTYGHPFHPLMGPHKLDVMDGNMPAAIASIHLFPGARFLAGIFSMTSFDDVTTSVIPSAEAIRIAGSYDTRIGGFGVLSQLIGLLSVAGLLVGVPALGQRSRAACLWFLYALVAVIASIAIHPENWWARYVPQLWLIPLMVASLLLLQTGGLARWVRRGLLVALVVNCLLVVTAVARVVLKSNLEIRRENALLLSAAGTGGSGHRVELFAGTFYGVWKRLTDLGLDVELVPARGDLSCPAPVDAAAGFGRASYCVVP